MRLRETCLIRTMARTIVRRDEHSGGAPVIEGTGIRVLDVAIAYESSGYDPEEIVELYPAISLSEVHAALSYYYDHIGEMRPHVADAGVASA